MNAISHSFKSAMETRLPPEVGKLQLQSVVHLLPANVYPEAVRDIYKAMTQLLYNNHLFSRWHLDNEYCPHSLAAGKGCAITKSFVPGEKPIAKLTESYAFVQDDLLRNRKYLWEKMQQKCATLFDLSEQFLVLQTAEVTKILTWTDTFLQIGEDFSGAFSSEMRTAIEKKVAAYFERVESQTWTSLMYPAHRTYLESEQWTRLPVPRNFDIDHMVASGLKANSKLLSALVSDHFSSSFSALVLSRPFEDEEAEEEFVGISATASTGLYEESPVLCTSAYHLVRSLVTMAGLVRTFTPISFKIFFSMTRLVDLFIYVVYFRFVLKQDKDRLLQHIDPDTPGLPSLEKAYDLHLFQCMRHTARYQSLRVAVVRTKDILDSKSESKSWLTDEVQTAGSPSVSESVIAINSCKLVLATIVALQTYVREALPEDTQDFLLKYYEECGATLSELDALVSRAVSYKLNKGEWLVKTVSEKPWDSHSAQASSYVNIILQYLEDVKERLANSPLPEKLKNEVMGQSIRHCIEQMMEGFAKVRVCSLSGRQQMATDLRAFHSSVDVYSVPLPDLTTDLEYLQVWSSPGPKALDWCLSHPKVPLRHHRNLLETSKDLQNQPSAARKAILDRLEVPSTQSEYRRMLREALES